MTGRGKALLERAGGFLTAWSTRWVPDAFVVAILLTGLTYLLALLLTPSGPLDLLRFWGEGFWELLSFAMQMCLIILTGSILAAARPVGRALERLAGVPRTPRGAVLLVALVSLLSAYLHWGLSLIGSAVLVRHVARRHPSADYRLLVASGYLGLGTLWHAGLSASAPLLVATPGYFLERQAGVIPVTQTLFHPLTLSLAAAVVVVMPLLARALHPGAGAARGAPRAPEAAADPPPAAAVGEGPARRLEASPVLGILLGNAALLWCALWFRDRGLAGLNLNTVNFAFLAAGLLLHRSAASFLRAAREGGEHVWGVIVQFPLYAGIYGIMKSSALQEVIARAFTSIATAQSYPVWVLWYSGAINYVVPSGGAKWAIEAPYLIQAARDLGVSLPMTVVAYAWGDMLTDIIQPFWAIPLLSVAGCQFRDIMGYCILFFLVYFALVSAGFALWAWA